MIKLEIWYDQEPENDFSTGDPVVVIETAAELDGMLDHILGETKNSQFGHMIQVGINGNVGYPVLEVGLGNETGFIIYHDHIGGSTKGDGSPDELIEYIFLSNLSLVSADVEVPITSVRCGLHEFMATGEPPSVITLDEH